MSELYVLFFFFFFGFSFTFYVKMDGSEVKLTVLN